MNSVNSSPQKYTTTHTVHRTTLLTDHHRRVRSSIVERPQRRLLYRVSSRRSPIRQHGARLLSRRHPLRVSKPSFSTNWNEPIVPGDVVVFSIPGQAIPIVHRVITNQEK